MTLTIPIAKQPDVSQIERLRPIVADRRCVVIGSAPLRTQYVDIDTSEITIPVNGAISSLQGPVDLWVLNSKAQDAPAASVRDMHKKMREQGRARAVRHLLMLRGPKVASESFTLATLSDLKCAYESWSVLDKSTKGWLEVELCGRDRPDDKFPCSSGILAVACTLWCGGASVRLAGFSVKPGYHYLKGQQPEKWWRGHVSADLRALVHLRARYGDKLSGDLMREVAAA